MSCENNGSISLAISLGFLSLIITLWAIFGTSHSTTPQPPNPLMVALGNLTVNFWVHYSTHPTDMLFKGWFWGLVGIVCMMFIVPILCGISDIINFFRKDKKQSIDNITGPSTEKEQ